MTSRILKPGNTIVASLDKVRDFVGSANETSNYLIEVSKSLKSGVVSTGTCKIDDFQLVNSLAGTFTDNSLVTFTSMRVYFSTLESIMEFETLHIELSPSQVTGSGVMYVYLTDTEELIHTSEKLSSPDAGAVLLLTYSPTGISLMMDKSNCSSVNYLKYTDLVIHPNLAAWALSTDGGVDGSSFSYILEGSSLVDTMMSGLVIPEGTSKYSSTAQSDGSGGLTYEPFISTDEGLLQFSSRPQGHGFTEGSYIGVTFYYNLGSQSILSVLEPESKGSVGEAMNPLILSGYTHTSALENNFHLAVGKLVIEVTDDEWKLDVSTDSPYWVPSTSQQEMMSLVLKSVVTWGTGL